MHLAPSEPERVLWQALRSAAGGGWAVRVAIACALVGSAKIDSQIWLMIPNDGMLRPAPRRTRGGNTSRPPQRLEPHGYARVSFQSIAMMRSSSARAPSACAAAQ